MNNYNAMTPADVQARLSEMNLSKVSRDLNVSYVTIRKYAHGVGNPRWSNLVKISKYLRGEQQ